MTPVDDAAESASARLLAQTTSTDVEAALTDVRAAAAGDHRVTPSRLAERSVPHVNRRLLVAVAAVAVLAVAGLVSVRRDRTPAVPSVRGPATSAAATTAAVTTTPATTTPAPVVPSAGPAPATAIATTSQTVFTTGTGFVAPVSTAPTSRAPPPRFASGTPIGIEAISVASPTDWWATAVAGDAPNVVDIVVHSTDGGDTWTQAPVAGIGPIKFADARNGWVGKAATHDGGQTWSQPAVATDLIIGAISSTSGAFVFGAAGLDSTSGRDAVGVYTAPTGSDEWAPAGPVSIPLGAGPLFDVSLAVGPNGGVLAYNDRGFGGGARLVDGAWVPWAPSFPCGSGITVDGFGDDIVANCTDGVWTDIEKQYHLYVSHNGGRTFREVSLPPGAGQVGSADVRWMAPGVLAALVLGEDRSKLWISDDAGATWQEAPGVPARLFTTLSLVGPQQVAMSAVATDPPGLGEFWTFDRTAGWIVHTPRLVTH